MPHHRISTRNHLLTSMQPEDLELLRPHLEPVAVHLRQVLVTPDCTIEHLYFLEGGLASVVVEGDAQHQSEVGIVGREGLTGIAVLLGTDRTPHKTFIQVTGSAWRIRAADFQRVIECSLGLQSHLLQYVHTFMLQVAQTASANARLSLDRRLARWVLMASDRLGAVDVPLTHEFLALMLGVRRPGVTETLHVLEGVRAIRNTRGQITITDRKALEMFAGSSYSRIAAGAGSRMFAASGPGASTDSE